VYLNGDRLYTETGKNLYVYSLSQFSSPIATYRLSGWCSSGIIVDKRLYLGGDEKLHIFEVSASSTEPLNRVTVIETKDWVSKILRVGQELLLGQRKGYFEVFKIKSSTITHTHRFTEGDHINDIIPIDDSHYLLAAAEGLLKTTKNRLINHYHKGKNLRSLCHVTDSLYLLGLVDDGLILWNEQTDQLLSKICDDTVSSIKRVMTTNNYIIKTF
jgi:hypothetical protein